MQNNLCRLVPCKHITIVSCIQFMYMPLEEPHKLEVSCSSCSCHQGSHKCHPTIDLHILCLFCLQRRPRPRRQQRRQRRKEPRRPPRSKRSGPLVQRDAVFCFLVNFPHFICTRDLHCVIMYPHVIRNSNTFTFCVLQRKKRKKDAPFRMRKL